MNKWLNFSDSELLILKAVLDDHCDRYDDRCDDEACLADEIDDEMLRRERPL